MTITLNGEMTEIPDRATVADLLDDFGAGGCAVAVNGSVVPRAEHTSYRLSGADHVEIVRAVQGG